MISEKMNNWLTDHFGGFTYAYENENYTFLLQDFTDEEVTKEVAQHNVTEWEDLRKILINSTEDSDVIAHLWGDTNAESRRQSIQAIKAIQEKMCDPYTSTEDDAFENTMNKLLSGEITYEDAIGGEEKWGTITQSI